MKKISGNGTSYIHASKGGAGGLANCAFVSVDTLTDASGTVMALIGSMTASGPTFFSIWKGAC